MNEGGMLYSDRYIVQSRWNPDKQRFDKEGSIKIEQLALAGRALFYYGQTEQTPQDRQDTLEVRDEFIRRIGTLSEHDPAIRGVLSHIQQAKCPAMMPMESLPELLVPENSLVSV
ncbi:MAG: hypothetical protein WDN27_02790 [Candidatus Saccharibacteria bacterium]